MVGESGIGVEARAAGSAARRAGGGLGVPAGRRGGY